jgi:hypothetical protein
MFGRTVSHDSRAQLNAEIEQLLREIRGLVLVKGVLKKRGVTRAELVAHGAEIERARGRLAELISRRGFTPETLGEAA